MDGWHVSARVEGILRRDAESAGGAPATVDLDLKVSIRVGPPFAKRRLAAQPANPRQEHGVQRHMSRRAAARLRRSAQ